jgi:trigger factor
MLYFSFLKIFSALTTPPTFPIFPPSRRQASGAILDHPAPGARKVLFVNVTVENVGPCKKLVRVEVDVKDVDAAFEVVTKDFVKHAELPGFRPGKAPRDMVVRRYTKEIDKETKEKLTRENYQAALRQEKLEVYDIQDIEDIQFGRSQNMQFAVTLEVLPQFELPAYRQLPAQAKPAVVTDADVEKALETLRKQATKFETVQRASTAADILVVNYQGTCDGQALSALCAEAKAVEQGTNYWVGAERQFLPGFFEQITGAAAGENRTVKVDFPAESVFKELSGKQATYEVQVVEVKEPRVPELDDALAKNYEAADLNALKSGVRRDLENEAKFQRNQSIRNQVTSALLKAVEFDLPASAVAGATRDEVYNIVAESQRRGIKQTEIEKAKDELYSAAANNAKVRLKLSFILGQIAAKENIKVTEQELSHRLLSMAMNSGMTLDAYVKEMEKRHMLPQLHQQMVQEKVLDFVAENAALTELAADAPAPAPADPA